MRAGSQLLLSWAFAMRPLSRSSVVGQAELRDFSHMPASLIIASCPSRVVPHMCPTPFAPPRSRTPIHSLSLQSRYLPRAGVAAQQRRRYVGSAAIVTTFPVAAPPTDTTEGAACMFPAPAGTTPISAVGYSDLTDRSEIRHSEGVVLSKLYRSIVLYGLHIYI